MPVPAVSPHFPGSYGQARSNFQRAAQSLGATVHANAHPTHRGVEGEELSMDVVRIGPAEAGAALIVSWACTAWRVSAVRASRSR
jgi:hypothetical protein